MRLTTLRRAWQLPYQLHSGGIELDTSSCGVAREPERHRPPNVIGDKPVLPEPASGFAPTSLCKRRSVVVVEEIEASYRDAAALGPPVR